MLLKNVACKNHFTKFVFLSSFSCIDFDFAYSVKGLTSYFASVPGLVSADPYRTTKALRHKC